jgi:hypothetical protein
MRLNDFLIPAAVAMIRHLPPFILCKRTLFESTTNIYNKMYVYILSGAALSTQISHGDNSVFILHVTYCLYFM